MTKNIKLNADFLLEKSVRKKHRELISTGFTRYATGKIWWYCNKHNFGTVTISIHREKRTLRIIEVPEIMLIKGMIIAGYDAKRLATSKQYILNMGRLNHSKQKEKLTKRYPEYCLYSIGNNC